MRILAVNAGSSTVKLSIVADGVRVGSSTVETGGARRGAPADFDRGNLEAALGRWGPVDAVGHRVVHGGDGFVAPVVIDPHVRSQLGALSDLDPLHLPLSLAAIDQLHALDPGLTQVACFDTAFHATIPPPASTYALPEEWRSRWPLRRFGFHGLSHASAARTAAAMAGAPVESLRLVTCHLGAGASLCAVHAGASVDTTMGFTPMDGLVMATRPGTVDPGLVLWLQTHCGMTAQALARDLEERAGLLGLCGHADMRDVLAGERSGTPRCALAVGVYVHRLRAGIAAMATAMGGIDGLVFTGGVGEQSPSVRARAANGLAFLGVAIDPEGNERAEPDADVTATGAPVRTVVVSAREDLEIARAVTALGSPGPGAPAP